MTSPVFSDLVPLLLLNALLSGPKIRMHLTVYVAFSQDLTNILWCCALSHLFSTSPPAKIYAPQATSLMRSLLFVGLLSSLSSVTHWSSCSFPRLNNKSRKEVTVLRRGWMFSSMEQPICLEIPCLGPPIVMISHSDTLWMSPGGVVSLDPSVITWQESSMRLLFYFESEYKTVTSEQVWKEWTKDELRYRVWRRWRHWDRCDVFVELFPEWVIPTNPNSLHCHSKARYQKWPLLFVDNIWFKEFLYCTSQAAFWASCVGPRRCFWDFLFSLWFSLKFWGCEQWFKKFRSEATVSKRGNGDNTIQRTCSLGARFCEHCLFARTSIIVPPFLELLDSFLQKLFWDRFTRVVVGDRFRHRFEDVGKAEPAFIFIECTFHVVAINII